ncbi:CRISPR-associated endoribonuclease Cas6 [Desulfolucanica intricata]|uniref:CRISPR-associated endoribonuclease Cas6 n=1 Tax=Desulfolucanica intricata TaxID=1285191 RepID=UPI002379A689|nr:CRISPR-associated endoribonuclease Cas6 [Desulfolucanica intricata]
MPIHYNYLIQSAIYAALPKETASRLHDKGYISDSRSFRMFTFSRLLGKFFLNNITSTITFPEGATLIITSPELKIFLPLLNNLLTKKHIRLGRALFIVEEIRIDEQKVEGDTLAVRTLSPVVVYSTLLRPEGGKYTCYYQPGEPEFDRLVTVNLAKKYHAFHGLRPPEGNVRVCPLDRPRLHVTLYKGIVVKGYTCRLKLHGPRELLQMVLDAGLGGKGSQGYGCVEKIMRR